MSSKKWTLMICTVCRNDLDPSDFFHKKSMCFHCLYLQKLKIQAKKKPNQKTFCRICEKEIRFDESLKRRQRNVFCSDECAIIGYRQKRENHWTKQLMATSPLVPNT